MEHYYELKTAELRAKRLISNNKFKAFLGAGIMVAPRFFLILCFITAVLYVTLGNPVHLSFLIFLFLFQIISYVLLPTFVIFGEKFLISLANNQKFSLGTHFLELFRPKLIYANFTNAFLKTKRMFTEILKYLLEIIGVILTSFLIFFSTITMGNIPISALIVFLVGICISALILICNFYVSCGIYKENCIVSNLAFEYRIMSLPRAFLCFFGAPFVVPILYFLSLEFITYHMLSTNHESPTKPCAFVEKTMEFAVPNKHIIRPR